MTKHGDGDDFLNNLTTSVIDNTSYLELSLNPTKCEVISNGIRSINRIRILFPEIKALNPNTAMMLRTPLDDSDSVDQAINVKLEKYKHKAELIQLLLAQDVMFLIRHYYHDQTSIHTTRQSV
ncbi:hypothetical protein GJ496_000193 [Pomphorhynchus laevis]|nr:hypothetical protein GJ496_000193 [Pomphorhynchus laevis]